MIGRARFLAVAVAVAGGSVAFGFGGSPATAATPPDSGWWWSGRAAGTVPVQLDPTPAVPDGGLYVAGDPSGPSGVSAVRVLLADDATDPVLTLAVADSVGTPAVDACRATTPWTPVDGGVWGQRPQADCVKKVTGTLSPDGTKLVFALGPLVSGQVVDVVLQPAVPDSGAPAPFSTAFEPVTSASVVTRSTGDTAAPEVAPSVADVAAPGAAVVTDSPTYAVATYDALPDLTTSAPAVAVEAPPVVASATPVLRAESVAVSIPEPEGFRYAIILALPLLLLAGCSYVGWMLTQPVDVSARRYRGAR